jgi:predicted unusual protein kinase regulating ubiquinone biosynthesis (AarF/ABC1/UbiB family)
MMSTCDDMSCHVVLCYVMWHADCRYSFRIPPYYTLLVRSLSVLEGIALASDPNYKVS